MAAKGKVGGARPGAGRPRKSEKHKGQIAKAEKRIADKLPEIADRLIELALGVWVEERDEEGVRNVYREPPDLKAVNIALERIMGKPRQAVEHSGPEGEPIRVDLKALPSEDLVTLERIAARLAQAGPEGAPG